MPAAEVDPHPEDRAINLDLESKVRLLTGASFWTTHGDDRIGLRAMVLSDGPAEVRGQVWDERYPSQARARDTLSSAAPARPC